MQKNKPPKIVFTGPESSGKTTLTKIVAAHYGTNWLPEYSRTYLTALDRPYSFRDLVYIAYGQLSTEKSFQLENRNAPFLFLDTSHLVLKCWSIFKYGFYDFRLESILKQNLPEFYFLCDWQIPWEDDSMRENPEDREVLYALYKEELEELEVPFFEVKGNLEERLGLVNKILGEYLNN